MGIAGHWGRGGGHAKPEASGMDSEINSWLLLFSDPEACVSHSLCPPLEPGQSRRRVNVFLTEKVCVTFTFINFQGDGGMKTYQSVIKAEGADVIGGDVALSERL